MESGTRKRAEKSRESSPTDVAIQQWDFDKDGHMVVIGADGVESPMSEELKAEYASQHAGNPPSDGMPKLQFAARPKAESSDARVSVTSTPITRERRTRGTDRISRERDLSSPAASEQERGEDWPHQEQLDYHKGLASFLSLYRPEGRYFKDRNTDAAVRAAFGGNKSDRVVAALINDIVGRDSGKHPRDKRFPSERTLNEYARRADVRHAREQERQTVERGPSKEEKNQREIAASEKRQEELRRRIAALRR